MKKHKRSKKLVVIIDILIFVVILFILLLIIYILNNDKINKNFLKYQETSSLVSEDNLIDTKGKNDIYIKKIKQEYGIVIEYGETTKKYTSKFNATLQDNENIVNNNLNLIYKSLKKYPSDVFKKDNQNLHIILFDKFANSDLAIASRSSLNEFNIYICNNEKFERTLHHEIYHILEYHIEDKDELCFANWSELNPKAFNYDPNIANLDELFVYNDKINSLLDYSNIYFVSKYSKISEKEDRAEVFAESMLISNKVNFLKNTTNLNKKLVSITDSIKKDISLESFYFYKYME